MSKFQEIINSDIPTLVDFYADWCGPCKMQAPVMKELSKKIGNRARIIKVDVDKNQNASTAYGVRSIPTLILFKNGKIVWRHMGFSPLNDLNDVIEYHITHD
ncbi:MAG: thioredoxin [Cyclobacteriaceae bacterium]|nr:thioredoxin [Cyclobacteriaceae bacterium]